MGRNKGTFNFSANLEVRTAAPLDPRLVVDSVDDLVLDSTWDGGDGKAWLYEGMVVSIRNSHKLVMLTNYNPETNADAYQIASNWVEVDASAAHIDIINNLTTNDANKALSASQGKILKEQLDGIETRITSVFSFKGTVTNTSDLPASGNATGDVWHISSDNSEYVWDGSAWEYLGVTVDLSGYATASSVTAVQNSLQSKVDKVDGKSLISDTLITQITTNENAIAALQTSVGEKQEVLTAGQAISIADNIIDVKLDSTSSTALSKSANGIKLDLSKVKGTDIQIGTEITGGVSISSTTTITSSLQEIADAIESAVSGSITQLGSTDDTININGSVTSKDLTINIAKLGPKLAVENSAIKAGTDGKLDIYWEDLV